MTSRIRIPILTALSRALVAGTSTPAPAQHADTHAR